MGAWAREKNECKMQVKRNNSGFSKLAEMFCYCVARLMVKLQTREAPNLTKQKKTFYLGPTVFFNNTIKRATQKQQISANFEKPELFRFTRILHSSPNNSRFTVL